MPSPKELPIAPPGSAAVPVTSIVLDRLDGICVFLQAIHGDSWVRRAALATGFSNSQIRHFWQGRALPPLIRLAALEAYAIEEGFVATNPALRACVRQRRKNKPQVSENRKKYFIIQIREKGPSTQRLVERLQASLKPTKP